MVGAIIGVRIAGTEVRVGKGKVAARVEVGV